MQKVKYNFWDKFFGSRPKKFMSEANKQIKNTTLLYMQKYGRRDWVKVEDIFQGTLEKSDLFNSEEGKMFFAKHGIKSKLNSITNTLRAEGHPIISGTSKGRYGKGYRYADETCDDFVDVWDEKFSAWEKRKSNLSKEKQTDVKLIEKIIERLISKNKVEQANQLKQVLVQYNK